MLTVGRGTAGVEMCGSLDDWVGREASWLSLLSPPMQELVVPCLSVAQRLFLVEPSEEAFAKLVCADHDGTGGSGLDDPWEETCDGRSDLG